jgi:thiamine-phosphate pyrophosphorylase
MTISVITSPDKFTSEIPIVIALFKEGLVTLHLRKTKFSTKKLREYIDSIPKEFHSRIIIHSHHHLALKYKLKGIHLTRTHLKKKMKCMMKILWYRIRKPGIFITRSFHHLEGMQTNRVKYSYVFLNPFFSKTEPNKNHFDISSEYLKKSITNYFVPVFASGNINAENLHLLRNYGLSGVALSRIILSDPEKSVEDYRRICELLESKSKSQS